MEELKEGKFIISKNRLIIGKIVEINEPEQYLFILSDSRFNNIIKVGFDNILKCVDELIDLVEVKDIVNGYTIEKITQDVISKKKKLLTGHWDYNWQGDGTLLQFYNEDIQTIETKERFENDCYYV